MLGALLAANPLWLEGHGTLAQIRGQHGGDPVGSIDAALLRLPTSPELHRLRGEFLLRQGAGEGAGREAEDCFRQALAIARRQQAQSLELRAAMSLGRLGQKQGRQAEARPALLGVGADPHDERRHPGAEPVAGLPRHEAQVDILVRQRRVEVHPVEPGPQRPAVAAVVLVVDAHPAVGGGELVRQLRRAIRRAVVDDEHLDRAVDERADLRVFVLHHHLVAIPGTGRERNQVLDAGDVLALLRDEQVDLVLSGHRHVPYVWPLAGMLIVHSGTVSTRRVRGFPDPAYNLVRVERESISVELRVPGGDGVDLGTYPRVWPSALV